MIACLKEYFKNYSKPKQIVADKGSSFRSQEIDEFMNEYNIELKLIATASPWANGQIEIVNKTLGPLLGKFSEHYNGKRWPDVLSEIEFAFNNTVHKTTGETPSRILFGIDQNGKVNDYIKEFVESSINEDTRDLKTIREKAKEKTEKSQGFYKKHADKKCKEAHSYELGDYVMKKNFDSTVGYSSKLKPRYKGPYEVVKILRYNRYLIRDIDGFQ